MSRDIYKAYQPNYDLNFSQDNNYYICGIMSKRPTSSAVDPRPVQRSRLSELPTSPITISDDEQPALTHHQESQQQRHEEARLLQTVLTPVNPHRGVGTMHMWLPVQQQHLINAYYMQKGVFICPSCNIIVPTEADFMRGHNMANGFTRKKRDVYIEHELHAETNLTHKHITNLLYVSTI